MFLGMYTDPNGVEHANLYYRWSDYFADTFSPMCKNKRTLEFKLDVTHKPFTERSSYNAMSDYRRKQARLEEIAVEWSWLVGEVGGFETGLSMWELSTIENWFAKMGKRYGLMKDFKENAIC